MHSALRSPFRSRHALPLFLILASGSGLLALASALSAQLTNGSASTFQMQLNQASQLANGCQGQVDSLRQTLNGPNGHVDPGMRSALEQMIARQQAQCDQLRRTYDDLLHGHSTAAQIMQDCRPDGASAGVAAQGGAGAALASSFGVHTVSINSWLPQITRQVLTHHPAAVQSRVELARMFCKRIDLLMEHADEVDAPSFRAAVSNLWAVEMQLIGHFSVANPQPGMIALSLRGERLQVYVLRYLIRRFGS